MSSYKLKQRLLRNATDYCNSKQRINGFARSTAFIFDDVKHNFYQESYGEILKNPDWENRTLKKHAYFKDGTVEMQSSNSSDAMLMNIFCNPSIEDNVGLNEYLNIKLSNIHKDIIFGWNPIFENETKSRLTECDMRIHNHIFEAKLTESSFTSKSHKVLSSYNDFEKVFDISKVHIDNQGKVKNYQLYRNILAAYKFDLFFTVLLDKQRKDLIEEVNYIKSVIKNKDLANRVEYKFWQDVINFFDSNFKSFMYLKYFKES